MDYKVRRDTLENWLDSNPILKDGKLAAVTDKQFVLIGDGKSTFKALYEVYLMYHSFREG